MAPAPACLGVPRNEKRAWDGRFRRTTSIRGSSDAARHIGGGGAATRPPLEGHRGSAHGHTTRPSRGRGGGGSSPRPGVGRRRRRAGPEADAWVESPDSLAAGPAECFGRRKGATPRACCLRVKVQLHCVDRATYLLMAEAIPRANSAGTLAGTSEYFSWRMLWT